MHDMPAPALGHPDTRMPHALVWAKERDTHMPHVCLQAYVWLSCGILGHLNFQYVNVMTNK